MKLTETYTALRNKAINIISANINASIETYSYLDKKTNKKYTFYKIIKCVNTEYKGKIEEVGFQCVGNQIVFLSNVDTYTLCEIADDLLYVGSHGFV